MGTPAVDDLIASLEILQEGLEQSWVSAQNVDTSATNAFTALLNEGSGHHAGDVQAVQDLLAKAWSRINEAATITQQAINDTLKIKDSDAGGEAD